MPELTWQERFDADFPHGLVMRWFGDVASPRYTIERVEVIAEQDAMPVIYLQVSGAQKSFEVHVLDYHVIGNEHLTARVRAMSIPDMLWSAIPG